MCPGPVPQKGINHEPWACSSDRPVTWALELFSSKACTMGHEPATQLDLCYEPWVCFSGSPVSWILGHIFSKACTLGPWPSRQYDLSLDMFPINACTMSCRPATQLDLYHGPRACSSTRPVPWALSRLFILACTIGPVSAP
jgi:hypothetical protein